MLKNILLLGLPGSGKGTQAQLLEKNFNYSRIDTGSLIRSAIKNETPLGKIAKSFVEKGQLIPDNLVIDLVLDKAHDLMNSNLPILFDGFPRNLSQAQALATAGINLSYVIQLNICPTLLIQRIIGRRLCINRQCGAVYHTEFQQPEKNKNLCDLCDSELYQRDDDQEELVKNRIETYQTETFPLIEHYTQQNILNTIDADNDMDKIHNKIAKLIQ